MMFKKVALFSFSMLMVMMLIPAVVLKAAGEYEGPAVQIGEQGSSQDETLAITFDGTLVSGTTYKYTVDGKTFTATFNGGKVTGSTWAVTKNDSNCYITLGNTFSKDDIAVKILALDPDDDFGVDLTVTSDNKAMLWDDDSINAQDQVMLVFEAQEKIPDPAEPTAPAQPTSPACPAEPTTPAQPTSPAGPAEPTAPAQPTSPAGPTKPAAKPDDTEPTGAVPTGTADPDTDPTDSVPKGTDPTTPDPKGKTPTAGPSKKVTPAPSVSLKLNRSSAIVNCGKGMTLMATLKNSKAKITWSSSDTKIATVDSNGKVKTKMAGAVTITATAEGKSASCNITVLYKDVTNSGDFWYKPTNYLTAKGVVKGYDKQTKFKPANKCTRAQMVTFIWRLQGEPSPKSSTCKFSDVKSTDYFYKACIWGNEKHIVEGYKDGTFGPQIVCARRHAVTFLWRLAGKPDPKTKKNKFSDVKKSDYFYKATLWASEKKILAGYEDGTFRPNGDCLRRQMVTFLYKYDKNINKKG